jgi:hypothetical protein
MMALLYFHTLNFTVDILSARIEREKKQTIPDQVHEHPHEIGVYYTIF